MSGLVGHREAVASLREAATSGRLHHAWLLAGPKGIGKARFAGLAAHWLLARATGRLDDRGDLTVPAEHPTARLLAAGSHPDFKLLERLVRDKTEDRARSITIDQVRSLQATMAMTPSLSDTRIVIVDAAEDMERPGANALLKLLEEPPAGTIFLLVSHAPGSLLPTIRSRCRVLRFSPLEDAETRAVLDAALPQADTAEIDALVAIAEGAPGTALRFAGLEIAALDAAIEKIAVHGDPTNALRAALARTLALKAAQPRYEAFLARAPSRIAAAARTGRGDIAATVALWSQARRIADSAVRLSLDPQLTVFEIGGLLAKVARG